jgi:hypothetical protein
MARRIEVTTLDDLTGEPAQCTVTFGFRGAWFELDLTDANAASITSLLSTWSTHGRLVHEQAGPHPAATGTTKRRTPRAHSAAVRTWAREMGLPVAERGRLPAAVVRAYRERRPPADDAAAAESTAPGDGDTGGLLDGERHP